MTECRYSERPVVVRRRRYCSCVGTGAILFHQLLLRARGGLKGSTWQHPYIANGDRTPFWDRWGFWFHVGAIVWSMLALIAFIVGMIVVRNGIVRL